MGKIFRFNRRRHRGPWARTPRRSNRRMAASIWFTVVALIGLAAAWYLIKEHDPKTLTGRASVIDGDTIKIHGKRVRFNGIDAPESDYLCKDEKGEEYRQCGRYSAGFLAKFLSESSPTRCEIGVAPVKWSTHWDRNIPISGGPENGWKARQARRDCIEAAPG